MVQAAFLEHQAPEHRSGHAQFFVARSTALSMARSSSGSRRPDSRICSSSFHGAGASRRLFDEENARAPGERPLRLECAMQASPAREPSTKKKRALVRGESGAGLPEKRPIYRPWRGAILAVYLSDLRRFG